MNQWSNFFAAIAGASATLTGLIFVGVSLSLARILALPALPGRASESLILLVTALIVSALCLVPGQPLACLGWELTATGIVVWCITLRTDLGILRNTIPQYRSHAVTNIMLTQIAVLPYIGAGITMLCIGTAGVYCLIPAILLSFIKAVLDAWVLLVEIHR